MILSEHIQYQYRGNPLKVKRASKISKELLEI